MAGDYAVFAPYWLEGAMDFLAMKYLGAAQVVAFFRETYGPFARTFACLDATGQAALARDMEYLWTQHDQATDGTTSFGAE
jgi:hypothetical protein